MLRSTPLLSLKLAIGPMLLTAAVPKWRWDLSMGELVFLCRILVRWLALCWMMISLLVLDLAH